MTRKYSENFFPKSCSFEINSLFLQLVTKRVDDEKDYIYASVSGDDFM